MLSTPSRTRTALVIGGGIAGPVLAMFLERAGITPVIYECRPGPADETGAFLNLAPNGLAILKTLGIAGDVHSRPRVAAMAPGAARG